MKATLYVSAVKTPFDSEFSLSISSSDHDAIGEMQQQKLGSFEVELPADIERAFNELTIAQLEDQLFEAFQNYEKRAAYLNKKISQLNPKKTTV